MCRWDIYWFSPEHKCCSWTLDFGLTPPSLCFRLWTVWWIGLWGMFWFWSVWWILLCRCWVQDVEGRWQPSPQATVPCRGSVSHHAGLIHHWAGGMQVCVLHIAHIKHLAQPSIRTSCQRSELSFNFTLRAQTFIRIRPEWPALRAADAAKVKGQQV